MKSVTSSSSWSQFMQLNTARKNRTCAGLRGSLMLWIAPDALANWAAVPRMSRGGPAQYSDVVIESTLMLGCAFRLRLSQGEGLMRSVLALTLPVPEHTTLSRRG
jgi:hypothetical protein